MPIPLVLLQEPHPKMAQLSPGIVFHKFVYKEIASVA